MWSVLLISILLFMIGLWTHNLLLLLPLLILIIGLLIVRRKMRREYLRRMARETIDIFNNQGVDYWVDYGTLLGIVRENDIIEHDNDVDICVMNTPENHILLHKAFTQLSQKEKGRYIFSTEPWGAYRIRILYNGMNFDYFTDIYLVNKEGDMYKDPTGKIPCSLVGKKTRISWNGLDVSAPEKIHESLLWRYGRDYMTPKKGAEAINSF